MTDSIDLETELKCALSLKEQDEILARRVPGHKRLFPTTDPTLTAPITSRP